jgi:N6-adenosine-specific RNA methylase IME4
MVWHKAGGFQPFNLPQYNCEFVVYGRKGVPIFLETKNFFTCFNGMRREHSRKPDEFYQLVARVCPAPRLDCFSREKREGFDQYGNEPERFSE